MRTEGIKGVGEDGKSFSSIFVGVNLYFFTDCEMQTL